MTERERKMLKLVIVTLIVILVVWWIIAGITSGDSAFASGLEDAAFLPLVFKGGILLPTPAPTQGPDPTITYPPPVTPQP